ncbi:MAG: YihA family ribosome biogenesis GTP-binding protein [Gemmatimonadaceae bacterium]|nr:YihA family ribosome biogenesis GTP-binding protein [Gemmatimonadaceae bacterium]
MSGDGTTTDPLVIRHLAFLGGMAVSGGWRPDALLPEIAFAGRSNVGKSSLLNTIVRRKAFARVSRTPGRTQEVNFFEVNKSFVIVDLPGYGYARVARDKRHAWQGLMDAYLRHTTQLRGVVALLDARREPSADDLDLLEYLADLEVPTLVAITKVDKLGAASRREALRVIERVTGLDADQMVPCSAHTGEGRTEIAEAMMSLLDAPAWRGTVG